MISFRTILSQYWTTGLLSLLVTLTATPVAIRVARRLGVMDVPDQVLKPHARPIPYLGGLAICLGWAAALVVAMARGVADWDVLGPILLGGLAVVTIGLLDDLRELAPKLRLSLTALLVAVVLVWTGTGFHLADSVLRPLGLDLPGWASVSLSVLAGVAIVLGACNSANLIDGLDGLCTGVTAIISLGFFVLASHLAVWGYSEDGDPIRLVMAIAMFGAALGFLPLNTNPAKIFMGDAGSMLLGYNCGMMILLFSERGIFRWVLGGLMVFSLPIGDTALAIYRRWRGGRPIFAGDRSHFYDQLVDRGMSVRRVVVVSYAVAVFFAVMGCLSMVLRARYALVVYTLVGLGVTWTLRILKMTRPERARPASQAGRPRLSVLFSSAGRRVALIQEFRRAAGDLGLDLKVHAADCQSMAPAFQVADRTVLVPRVNSAEYCDALLDYCRREGVHAVIPLIDPELLPLADARERFAAAGTRVVISSADVVRVCVDKVRTDRFLREHGFRMPRLLNESDLESPVYPLFIKPRSGSSSLGAHKIRTATDLAYYRTIDPDSIVQEFVDGVEYTVDVFADFAGRARCAVPRRRYEVRGGEVSKGQAVRHERMMAEHCRLVDTLGGCRGMITIQCFLTPGDEIVFIEINPRFGGGAPLSIRAGADSPRWLLEVLLDREPRIDRNGWTDGLFMLRYDEGIFVPPTALPQPAPSPRPG